MASLDVYLLPRDATETTRLNRQHQIYKDTLGYLLSPKIPIKGHMQVADVATGTGYVFIPAQDNHRSDDLGIFLIDLANSILQDLHPHFTGFDISSSQFPPSSTLPFNIELQTHNILDQFPAEIQGTFDVVHARLVGQVFQSVFNYFSTMPDMI